MARRLLTVGCRSLAAVSDVAHQPALHQGKPAARHTFAVEGWASLEGVRVIVVDRNVVPKDFFPDAVVQETPTVANGGSAKITEHLANQVEHRRGFQDYGVAAGRDDPRRARVFRLSCCAHCQFEGVQLAVVAGTRL